MNDAGTDNDDDEDEVEENLPEYTVDYDLAETDIEHKWSELHADAVEVSESTHRLAVCNMDWDFVKAQDLFVLLKSFVPDGGRVKSVIIYPSEFGKERMAEEALLGPKEMRDMVDERDSKGGEEEEGKGKRKKKRKEVTDNKQQKDQEKDVKRYETEKLREYQLNRLRYFYAVVDCDSVGTADAIYKECDGKEYQLSSVQMDLRYIPDDMTFDDEAKDNFSQDQTLMDYTPSTFNSTALSQANVDVTWDETDFDRLSRRVVGLQRKELESMVEENQYADMIAPAESDSEVENDSPDWLKDALADESEEEEGALTEDKKIILYRKVLMEKLTGDKEEPEDVDQEIEWTPGLKTTAQEKLKKKKKGKEAQNDIVEGYLEKKRLKKKKKIEVKKKQASAENDDNNKDSEDVALSDDDMPGHVDGSLKELMESEGVSLSKKSKKAKKNSNKAVQEEDSEAEREWAELELLMMGDGDKHIAKPHMVEGKESSGKMSKKKKKKLAKLAKEKKAEDKKEFTLDMDNDDRFNALFTSHHFHIDPNAPQFKKTHNMEKLVDEQISRKKKVKTKHSNGDAFASGMEQPASSSVSKQLVESLKKKMKIKNKK